MSDESPPPLTCRACAKVWPYRTPHLPSGWFVCGDCCKRHELHEGDTQEPDFGLVPWVVPFHRPLLKPTRFVDAKENSPACDDGAKAIEDARSEAA